MSVEEVNWLAGQLVGWPEFGVPYSGQLASRQFAVYRAASVRLTSALARCSQTYQRAYLQPH
jgi:hypothetical protein